MELEEKAERGGRARTRDIVIVRSVANYVKSAAGALVEISLRTEGLSKLSLESLNPRGGTERRPRRSSYRLETPPRRKIASLKVAAINGDLSTIATLTEMYTVDGRRVVSPEAPVKWC